MRTILSMLLAIAAFSTNTTVSVAEEGERSISVAKSVLAIYTENFGIGMIDNDSKTHHRKLVIAVWGDGHVVWSENRITGGAPYHQGRVDKEKIAVLLSRMEKDGLFIENKKLTQAQYGFDSAATTILIKSGKHEFKMQSWHELFEHNGKTVVTNHGVTGLEGRRRLNVLAKTSSEYLFYRFVWAETRSRIASLQPSKSTQIEGELSREYGTIAWKQSSK